MIIRSKAGFRDVLLAVRGSTAQRIALRCGLMTLLACGAVYWAQYLPVALSRLGIAPFTLIGMAISTLLGFRNSACHARWWEGRQQWGPPQVWRSGGNRLRMRGCIIGWVEFLSVAGTERAAVDRAANLEQEIGPSSRPAHLLGFIHSAVHQKIGCPLGDRSPNPQPGTGALGIIDHPAG
jgi:hypothetical protein